MRLGFANSACDSFKSMCLEYCTMDKDNEFHDVDSVGQFRFCPSCGSKVIRKSYFYDLDEQALDEIDLEEIRCSRCDRPWIACPCYRKSDDKEDVVE